MIVISQSSTQDLRCEISHSPKLSPNGESGAGDATRTRDIFLGKEVLYQLSYTRIGEAVTIEKRGRVASSFSKIL